MIQDEDCSVFHNSKMLTSIHLCLYPAFTQSVHISWYAIFRSTAFYTAVCKYIQKGSCQLHNCKYTWRKLPTELFLVSYLPIHGVLNNGHY